jgi:hypothetical protein
MNASPLAHWDTFYVIVGSAAAALIGLQFVAMAIAADAGTRSASSETIDAFGTPNIVHFSAVLLVAALLSAPWPSLRSVDVAIGACAFAGLVYGVIVVRRARRQTEYQPVLEDWIWHAALPLVAYGVLTVAAAGLTFAVEDALFAVAASALLLLFIGIHNAWDTVTYLAVGQPQADAVERDGAEKKS